MSGNVQGVSFTGSLPYDNRVSAVRSVLPFGPYLDRLPQGEIERRETWVLPIIDRMRDGLGLQVAVEGQAAYGRLPQYRFPGEDLYIPREVLGIDEEIEDLVKALDKMRKDGFSLPTEVVQVGFPHSADIAGFCFTPPEAERLMPAIEQVISNEAAAIASRLGRGSMAIMLESPFTLQSVLEAHERGDVTEVRRLMKLFARSFCSLAEKLPFGVPIYVHLCNGDFGGRSKHDWTSIELIVRLANAIDSYWPHRVAYLAGIHLPVFGGANQPIPLDLHSDGRLFDPLADLSSMLKVIYGGVHPMVTAYPQMTLREVLDINQRALDLATTKLDRQFQAVSWPCGGRFKGAAITAAYGCLDGLVSREGANGPLCA